MNWPVSKKIGGQEAVVPKEVIGAHGGFPLSEWQKYLESPENKLLFKGQDYTRKVRYLTDEEKKSVKKGAAGPFLITYPSSGSLSQTGLNASRQSLSGTHQLRSGE